MIELAAFIAGAVAGALFARVLHLLGLGTAWPLTGARPEPVEATRTPAQL